MVKRYTHDESFGAVDDSEGELCEYADYLALQSALREALDGWASWAYESRTIHEYDQSMRRLSELRAKFLES